MSYYAAAFPNLFSAGLVASHYGSRRFNVIDGGSRGDLFEPLKAVQEHWHSYAFDADEDAAGYPGHVTRLPYGLWSETKRVKLHVAVDPSTSSVYPPDVERFDLLYGPALGTDVRTTAKVVDVPCISVDDAVSQGLMGKPHFFKLDVHSAEYEALAGARNSLDECVCVLVETWTHPLHKGQKTHGHVEALLNDMGFYLYEMARVCPTAVLGKPLRGDRGVLTSTDSLFFPDRVRPDLGMLHVALLDLFRYTNLAAHMCDVYRLPSDVKEALLSFPRQRALRWTHPRFYKRWIKNIAKSVLFPDREVTFHTS